MDFRVECTGVTHKELEQGREESQETIKCIAFMYIYTCLHACGGTCVHAYWKLEVNLICLPSPYILS